MSAASQGQTPQRQMPTWAWIAAAVVLVSSLLGWGVSGRAVPVEVAQARLQRFEQTIEEDGRTRLQTRFAVSAPLTGRIARIDLREGDTVVQGQVVALMTPLPPSLLDERSWLSQQARIASSEAGVRRAMARVARARAALAQAATELIRAEQLAGQGFISPTRLEQDRLAEMAARRDLDAALAEEDGARHDLEQTRFALTSARDTLPVRPDTRGAPLAVRAPADGRVLKVLQSSEASVQVGTPLLELGDIRALEVVAELLSTDAVRVPTDAPVRIEHWGGPQALAGRVMRVEPGAFTKVSALGVEEQRVRVVIGLTSPAQAWQALGDGFRVGVRILTEVSEQALCVPVSAVFVRPAHASSQAEATPMAVFVVESGRARLTPVGVAARNQQWARVTEGLSPGQTVIVYPSVDLRDGARVSVRPD